MWIFLPDAFLSIVKSKNNNEMLVVRARRPGDIEKVFPSAKVYTLTGRDYQFRADVKRIEVAEAMFAQVMDMQQTNFKDSVHDNDYHDACSRVWGVMANLQPVRPYSTASHVQYPQVAGRAKRQKRLI